MKKLLTLGVIAVTLICIDSCKKAASYTNYFSFLGTSYPVTVSGRDSTVTTRSITFADPTTVQDATITCTFDSIIPVTGGVYKIVGSAQPAALNQMTLQLTVGPNTYIATGNDNINATVTVSASKKVSISIPPVWVASTPGDTLGNPAVDSSKLSGTVSE